MFLHMFYHMYFWCYILCMGRRKVGEEKIRSIQKCRNTYMVSVPIELMRELGWRERQRVVITRSGKGKLVIADYTE